MRDAAGRPGPTCRETHSGNFAKPVLGYPKTGLKLGEVPKSVFTGKYERFRLLLVEARKTAHLSQTELAKKLTRPQSFVSKYGRGERRLDVIEFEEVAEALGIPPIEFLRKAVRTQRQCRVKIVRIEILQNCGKIASSSDWRLTRKMLHKAIERVSWPEGSGGFTIYPEEQGNGVKTIKRELMAELEQRGWKLERSLEFGVLKGPGKLDAVLETKYGPIALEWETGNISSSHRALNKMALGLLIVFDQLVFGVVVTHHIETTLYDLIYCFICVLHIIGLDV